MTARSELLGAALAAAERGWRVFPLCPGRKRPPRREAADWERRATSDPARIERWWRIHPLDNVGIACGPSGLVVVDLDPARPGEQPPPDHPGAGGGADVFAALAARHAHPPYLPATWTVASPSGGRHVYYLARKGVGLRNTQGALGWHVDTRAGGGYVVAAGSRTPTGTYVVVDDAEPAELPAWLAQLLTPDQPPAAVDRRRARPAPPAEGTRKRTYLAAALEGEVRRVRDAGPGARNAALARAAWNLGRFVAAGDLPRHEAEDVLCRAGIEAGYRDGPRAVAAVVRNAITARLRRTPHTNHTTTEDTP